MKLHLNLIPILLIGCLSISAIAQDDRSTRHDEGLRENRPSRYVLTEATAILAPGQQLENVMVFVRDGKIESVQKGGSKIPATYREIKLKGKRIYPGLIDAYTETDVSSEQLDKGAPYWNSNIRPQIDTSLNYVVEDDKNQAARKSGITSRLVVPGGGIIKGKSTLVSTGEGDLRQMLVRKNIAQHAVLSVQRRFRSSGASNRPSYPNSPMGAVALARQAMYDAQWYLKANQTVVANPSLPRPESNDALKALESVVTREQPIVIESANELYFLRAHRFANEFNLKAVIRGSGFEFRRLDEIAKTGRSIILPVNFPSAPNVASFESALNVSLETLMEWDHAPENPARLASAGVEFAFCSNGLSSTDDFLKNIRIAVKRGLSSDAALQALTTTPAKLFGASDLVGKIEKGMLANLVITDGDLFDSGTKIEETWVAGVRFEHSPKPELKLGGTWKLQAKPETYRLSLESSSKSTKGSIELIPSKKPSNKNKKGEDETEDEKVRLSKAGIQNNRFSAVFDASKFGGKGMSRITIVFTDSMENAEGFLTTADGKRVAVTLTKWDEPAKKDEPAGKKNSKATKSKKKKSKGRAGKEASASKPEIKTEKQKPDSDKATYPVNYPLGAFGRTQSPAMETVLIKNVTIWTCGKQGIIPNGSVLIQNGKIAMVGTGIAVEPSKDLVVVDGTGMHLTPGIIDCHSHMASDGGINESGQAITAEVRIGDFINCNDVNIYRQLAGGVTSSNILHGSANPIGGQNQVIKLRWGMIDEDLKFSQAPQGIKFALGENVKRSRSPESTRYPKTRMGVEQIFLDEFRAAKGYEQQWKQWEKSKSGLPPRRDLELDAIVEILNQERWIHCHSYRQDEILALIRLLDGFKIQIGTFQHILEGYKVADAMKKHGAMGSAFSDWWAYKFEVFDAIPYAGALMHNAGVVVSFNSDDRELARHLNHEAAKAVKYGGVPPEEALKFVTLNPAKQLRIDQYVGSIEKGKHADVVLWSGDPLSTMSRCEKTWVDGRRMFDRNEDQKQRMEFEKMRQVLIQKVLASGQSMNSMPGGRAPKPAEMWPSWDEFCRCKNNK